MGEIPAYCSMPRRFAQYAGKAHCPSAAHKDGKIPGPLQRKEMPEKKFCFFVGQEKRGYPRGKGPLTMVTTCLQTPVVLAQTGKTE